jgi:hypothetical protein
MNNDVVPGSKTHAISDVSADRRRPPHPAGLPLGPVLGLTISVLVAAILGGLTVVQLHRDEFRERRTRESLLAESLGPLVEQVESANSFSEIARLLSSSRLAERLLGRPDFNIVLRDSDGRVVAAATGAGATSPPGESLKASVAVRPIKVMTGTASLVVWQSASELDTEMAFRRREALFDIGITVIAVIVGVQLTIVLLVARPLRRLLTSIDKFEQGYPARFRSGSFALELSWLEWKLEQMSIGLTRSARLLVAAHRRAKEASTARKTSEAGPSFLDPLTADHADLESESEIMRRHFCDRCAILEHRDLGRTALEEIALDVWQVDAPEAERLGESHLRVRLENAALAILDPDAYEHVRLDLEAIVTSRSAWCAETTKTIASVLADEGIPHVEIQSRAKHVAGVWRKMQEKQLSIEEVHDILAFRIIVPETDHCYLALETVHRLFDPEPFRFKDYIAKPKANGYQSLHTSVRNRDGLVFEIQIRSYRMHRAAELGDAAHWRYRANKGPVSSVGRSLGHWGLRRWMREGRRRSAGRVP